MKIQILGADKPKRVFALIGGKAGCGKTTQLTTFPVKETLGISVENGFLSIAGSGHAYGECTSYDEVLKVVINLKKDYPWVKYLFIDSITEIYDLLKNSLKAKYTAKQNFAKNDDMYDMLLYLVRKARQLNDVSVFFTCHTKWEKNGLSQEQDLAFDGKMPEAVKKQFDLCIHLDGVKFDGQTDTKRMFITNPDISKVAKARVSPWLDIKLDDYEEPNLYKLSLKLMGKNS